MENDKYVFFWSGPFSQWHKSHFELHGIKFCCAEQYMMYKKAILFGDEEVSNAIMRSFNPKEHKELGRKVRNFKQDVWEKHCKKYVYDGNYAKFSQNEDLRKELFKTAGKELVEASPNDIIWGVGLHEDDEKILDKKNWQGKNWLGEILTQVRIDLSKELGINEPNSPEEKVLEINSLNEDNDFKDKKVYISIPYTGVESLSFKLTNLVAGKLLDAGSIPISPISHSHPIEEHCKKKWSWEVWSKVDYALLEFCDEVLVVNFDDEKVKKSVGVQDEIKHAKKNGKPIRFMNVDFSIDLSSVITEK